MINKAEANGSNRHPINSHNHKRKHSLEINRWTNEPEVAQALTQTKLVPNTDQESWDPSPQT